MAAIAPTAPSLKPLLKGHTVNALAGFFSVKADPWPKKLRSLEEKLPELGKQNGPFDNMHARCQRMFSEIVIKLGMPVQASLMKFNEDFYKSTLGPWLKDNGNTDDSLVILRTQWVQDLTEHVSVVPQPSDRAASSSNAEAAELASPASPIQGDGLRTLVDDLWEANAEDFGSSEGAPKVETLGPLRTFLEMERAILPLRAVDARLAKPLQLLQSAVLEMQDAKRTLEMWRTSDGKYKKNQRGPLEATVDTEKEAIKQSLQDYQDRVEEVRSLRVLLTSLIPSANTGEHVFGTFV